MSYASALLAMCLGHNPLIKENGEPHWHHPPRWIAFYKALRGGIKTRLNNDVDGNGLWVDALT